MTDLILTTYDWVPEPPRGYVLTRARWALEEAGLPYLASAVVKPVEELARRCRPARVGYWSQKGAGPRWAGEGWKAGPQ